MAVGNEGGAEVFDQSETNDLGFVMALASRLQNEIKYSFRGSWLDRLEANQVAEIKQCVIDFVATGQCSIRAMARAIATEYEHVKVSRSTMCDTIKAILIEYQETTERKPESKRIGKAVTDANNVSGKAGRKASKRN